ncbi:MAG TPA: glycoside hydrolase family 31 protein [Chitinophagaceae bacterium]|nr:glycoside hydrolase family 31 protein [Chitinophagaceae bacterium]
MRKIYSAALLFFVAANFCMAQEPGFVKTADGLIVYPAQSSPGSSKAVRLKVYNDRIIRVTAAPELSFTDTESLTVIKQPAQTGWEITADKDVVVLKTKELLAKVNRGSGAVSFYDHAGSPILREREINGKSLQQVIEEGKILYSLRQVFESDPEEAYYGLGQHQDDSWNYKGKKVIFFQNNTEVAVPFLVSVKNYGILWDNYSYSEAGDVRPMHQLSALQLYDKNGNPGWLTASYYNDKGKTDDLLFEKAESEIWYPYMNDLLQRAPKEFKPANGKIVWEGSLSAELSGNYAFRFSYGGYLKLTVNGKTVFDKWRQAWNPGTALADIYLEKGKRNQVRIDWIPDGGESYVSATFLPPAPIEDEHTFSFHSSAGRQIDYYFIQGNSSDEVVKGYRELTGKAPIVPRWAMGFWQSRERYKSQEEILNTVAEFRKRRIPLDNIVQDWFYWKENDWGSQDFDRSRFPNADSMIEVMHKKYNAQLMISVWPKVYENIPVYNEFNKNGWLYTRNIADRQKDWVGPGYVSTFYDVFNEKARKAFWDLLQKKLYSKKVDAWWMDASEPDIQSNVSPEKRKQQMQPLAIGTAAEYMNAYPLMNAKGIYEGQRGTDSTKRVFLLTRSAFAGSQRYAASIWSGDIGARWEDMRTQISAGLNYSISGLPYWTLDIGGFATEVRYNKVPMAPADEEEWRELQTRWYQWGAFLPLFRSHGQFPVREVFNIAPEDHPAYKSMLYYNQLRYRLLPYTYSLAGHAYHQDYTLLRGLVMDFAADKQTWNIGDQFMFGPSLLVAPVYTYKARTRTMYLPAGQGWYDLYSGKFYEGGQTINSAATYERTPVFIKAGSIIPTGPALQYTSEKAADPLTLFIYTGKDASFTLYEDEGVNYNYEKGKFTEIPISFNQSTNTLTIGDRTGGFSGMLNSRTVFIKVVSAMQALPFAFDGKDMGRKIEYKGKKIVIRL